MPDDRERAGVVVREFVDLPRERDDVDAVADHRNGLPGPQQPEIPDPERTQDAEPRSDGGRGVGHVPRIRSADDLGVAGKWLSQLVEQGEIRAEVVRRQGVGLDALTGGRSQLGSPSGVGEQSVHRVAERGEVARVDEEPVHAVTDLVADAAHRRRHDGALLPHRLGHGEPEPFGQALLHHDVGAALERVHDDRVGLDIVGRQVGDVDPAPILRRQAPPDVEDLGEHRVGLGIVGHRCRPGSRQHQVRFAEGRVVREPSHDTDRVLQRIPPRHLHHQRGIGRRRARLGDLGPLDDRVGRAVFAEERRRTRRTMVQQARRPDDRLHVLGVELDVLAGRIVDARRDHVDAVGVEPMPGVGGPGERGGMRGEDIGPQEVPGRSRDRRWACRSPRGRSTPRSRRPPPGRAQPTTAQWTLAKRGSVWDHPWTACDPPGGDRLRRPRR